MPSGVSPSINLQEGLYSVAPTSVKQACFASKTGSDVLNSRPGIMSEPNHIANSKFSGMNLPMTPSPEVTNVCSTKPSLINIGILEDTTSTVTNTLSLFPNQFSSLNSGFTNTPAGGPNSVNPSLYPNRNQDSQLSVIPPNNLPLQQTMNMGSLPNEVPSPPASALETNPVPVGYNDFNKIGNNLRNALCNSNFSPTPQVESLSNLALNSELNKLTPVSYDKLTGSSTLNSLPSGLASSPTADTSNSLSISCPSNYVPTSTLYNANSCVPNNQPTQLPTVPNPSSAGLPVLFKDPLIYPTIQTYPPLNMYPILPQQHLLESNYLIPNEPTVSSNMCPLLNQKTSVNDYFKNVRAATVKLNDFITAFSNRLNSLNIPSLPSFSKVLSQIPSLVNTLPVNEKLESTLLTNLEKPTPPSVSFSQSNIMPCEESALITSTAPTKNSNICTPATFPPLPPVSLKAPKVPTLTVNTVNFPICSSPIQYNRFQDTLASVSSSNYSPQPITNLLTASSNPYTNLGTCNKLHEGALTNICKRKLSLPSVLKKPTFNTFNLPKHIISPFEEGTSALLPDVLSNVFPKISSKCKKPFPFISPVSINSSLDCDCSASSSNVNSCEFDFSSLQNSCVSSKPNLDESQLDECCKNLENVIAMLELSLNLNDDIDCNLDCVPDILSTL